MNKWQIDSIVRFFDNDKVTIGGTPADQIFAGMAEADSVKTGFFYKQLAAPQDTTSFKKDTVLYINYTGKLLNGLVFDTNIERVAKDNNLYSSSKTYEPMQINWAEKYEDLTMTSSKSDMIPGFAMTLWQMRSMEKGVGIFYSNYGYGVSGSGSSIPGYAPLIFEIELVAKPEKK
jgi:FKBP-type peptidyl-prolyl cis-trans isomerase FklB